VRRVVAFALALVLLDSVLAAPSTAEDAGPATPRLSPWTKVCLKELEGGAETCLTGRDAQTVCGPVGAAVLIERDGDATKTLRITLPPSVSQQSGVRITIDRGETIPRPYGNCHANGCMADYAGGAELVAQLKQGQTLLIEGTDGAGRPIAVTLPLTGFAQAYDGPSTGPHVFEAQQKRPQSQESKRRSDEARESHEQIEAARKLAASCAVKR